MKKVILFMTVMAIAFTSFSQTSMMSAVYPANALDSVTNTGTKSLNSFKIGGFQKTNTVAVTVTKISGTVAGTLSLLGSIDGVNWFTQSATIYTATDVASQTFSWPLVDFGSQYLRVQYTGTGTMLAAFGAKYLPRKQ